MYRKTKQSAHHVTNRQFPHQERLSTFCVQSLPPGLRSQQEGLLLSMLSKTNMLFIFSLLIAGDHTATSEMILTRYALLQIDKYDC